MDKATSFKKDANADEPEMCIWLFGLQELRKLVAKKLQMFGCQSGKDT